MCVQVTALTGSDAAELCKTQESLWIACFNGPASTTLGGSAEAISRAQASLQAREIFAQPG